MRAIRVSGIACLAVLVFAATGCGGDEENGSPQARTAPSTASETERTQSATAPTETTEPSETATSPEQQPGGAGDEEPAHSQALFTGRGGRVKPAVVRVPAYIAIRIELRSADGGGYALRFGNRTLRVDRTVSSASASFSGLRPGKALSGEPVDGGNRVRVEATAEPGP
jgi:hypothetical protein